jgi:hypothetical protein
VAINTAAPRAAAVTLGLRRAASGLRSLLQSDCLASHLRGFSRSSRSTVRMGITDDSGHLLAKSPDSSFDPVEATIDGIESSVDLVGSLIHFCLKREQILVNALDLLGQKAERAFDLADSAFQVANLCFDIHRHW